MIYHSDAKVICTHKGALFGTRQRLSIRTSITDSAKITLPSCGFDDRSPECVLCIRKLMTYLESLDLRNPDEVIRIEDLPDPEP